MDYSDKNVGVTAAVAGPSPQRLMDQVRSRLRVKHYSLRTEQAYTAWIRRFIMATGRRHPRELGCPEVEQFLTSLAVDGQVAAGTEPSLGTGDADGIEISSTVGPDGGTLDRSVHVLGESIPSFRAIDA